MALKKEAAPAGQFEGMEETTTAKRPAATIEQNAKADVAATTAIATAAASAVVVRKPFVRVLDELKCALDPINVGTLTRLKSGSGNIKDANGVDYGRYVGLQLLSFHDSWTISPGSDNDESKDLVRYSLDGKTIDGTGEDVDEYLKKIIEVDGYEKANKKRYLILAGIITDCEKSKDKVDTVVQVSLAPQSAGTFENYHMQRSVQVSQGKRQQEGSQMIRIEATAASATIKGQSKDYTKLVVTGELAA